MKLLFEGWRKHLKEVATAIGDAETKVAKPKHEPVADEYASPYEYEHASPREYSREQHFGKNPDHLKCVVDLRSTEDTNPMDFYRCMEQHGYNKIDAGSFRAVLTVPGQPDMVLKIVGPANVNFREKKRSMEMNRKEAEGSYQTSSDLIPKVYDSARDYFWILSEKVTPVKSWAAMQEFFPAWRDEPTEDFSSWFQKLIDAKTIPEVAAKQIDKRAEYTMGYEERGEDLVNDPLILDIRDLLGQFKLPAWDIRPHNVGYAVRNGQKQFVILDPGFGLGHEVGTIDEPLFPPERGISAIFDDDVAQTWQPENKKDIEALAEELNFLLKEDKVPDVNVILYFKPSKIHGKGIFAGELIPKGTDLGVSHMRNGGNNWIIPDFGRYHNHSESPNCRSAAEGALEDNIYIRKLIALDDIGPDEEITVDYRLQPELEQPEQWAIK